MRSLALCFALLSMGASCRSVIPDDKSAFAAEAGQNTIVLGSCESNFDLGWGHCLLEKGLQTFPTLRFVMTNPGDWAVGDCELGIYKTGAADKPGLVEVDLSGLRTQAERIGFCILKIEAVERYPVNNDQNQSHNIPLRGGFFLELVNQGYLPTPAKDVIGFCVKVQRTSKGRTTIENCK